MLRAEQYRIQIEKAAEGEKWALELGAEAYRQERGDVSEAEALRFKQQQKAYDASPELFVLNSFLDVLETDAAAVRKFVVASGRSTEVFIIDLQDKLRPDLLELDLTEE